jgi:hypothetical protein
MRKTKSRQQVVAVITKDDMPWIIAVGHNRHVYVRGKVVSTSLPTHRQQPPIQPAGPPDLPPIQPAGSPEVMLNPGLGSQQNNVTGSDDEYLSDWDEIIQQAFDY